MKFTFPYIGNVIIPTDELIFFRGVGQPPTRNVLNHRFWGPAEVELLLRLVRPAQMGTIRVNLRVLERPWQNKQQSIPSCYQMWAVLALWILAIL